MITIDAQICFSLVILLSKIAVAKTNIYEGFNDSIYFILCSTHNYFAK